MTVSRVRTLTLLLLLPVALVPSCKQGSSKKKSNKQNDNLSDIQRQLQNQSNLPRILLAGRGNGETVSVTSNDLLSLGIAVDISGLSSTSLVVGIINAPVGFTLTKVSNTSYRLKGTTMPVGIQDVAILARDRTKCGNAANCNIVPDGNGRFPTNVVANPTYDLQGSFKIQLGTGTNTLTNTNTNTGTGGIWGGIKNSGSSVLNWFKKLFGGGQP